MYISSLDWKFHIRNAGITQLEKSAVFLHIDIKLALKFSYWNQMRPSCPSRIELTCLQSVCCEVT